MGKKIVLVLISFLLIINLFSFVKTAEISTLSDSLQNNIDTLNDVNNKISNEDARTEYLKQEWTKVLEKYSLGRFILGISNTLKALSPIFKLFIGVEYSLSWIFFLSLFAWVTVVVIIYRPLKEIFTLNKWIALGIGIIIPTIAAQFGIVEKSVAFMAPILKNSWIIWISIIIALLLIYIYSAYIKILGKIIKRKMKKEDEIRREEKAKLAEKLNDIKLKGSK